MWNRILTFLAWAGLWQPPLVVFNRDAPVTRSPLNSSQLLNLTSSLMTSLLEEYATENGRQVAYQSLEQSVFYKQSFGQLGSLLQSADPLLLQPAERKTLFLNLYNLLTIDAIVKMDPLPESTISVPQFWRRFAYQVGPYTLHLDDIEHGVLRGNRPHPTTGTTMFSSNDPRLALTLPADHRIHGALNCGAMSCPPLQSFYVDQLEQQLDGGFHNFCNGSVKLLTDNSLLINSIFQWFRVDFGSTEGSVLAFLAEQVDDPTITQALVEASRGQRRFNYNYDWTLNARSGDKSSVHRHQNSPTSEPTSNCSGSLHTPPCAVRKESEALTDARYGRKDITLTSRGDSSDIRAASLMCTPHTPRARKALDGDTV